MNFEFMTIDTPLPPCMPFPRALTGFPVSSTAKVMYCRMLDAMLYAGQAVIFTLSLADGSQVEIIAYNPFIMYSGVWSNLVTKNQSLRTPRPAVEIDWYI